MATLGSKAPTPAALQFHKFQEWSQSNQQIFKLQSKILDLEAAKIRYSMLKSCCVICSRNMRQKKNWSHIFNLKI